RVSYATGCGQIVLMAFDEATGQQRPASDADGIARVAGGGEDRTQSGGDDNRTVGPDGLTFFESHARHEFGHTVADAPYERVENGNAFATKWAGWKQLGDAQFADAMFPVREGSETLTFPNGDRVTVTGRHVAKWCVSFLKEGKAPANNPITRVAIDDMTKLL